MRLRLVWLFVFFVAVIVIHSGLYAQGCSQCRLLTEQGNELEESSFGSNINTGILYLMIIPYLLLMFLFRKRIISLISDLKRK